MEAAWGVNARKSSCNLVPSQLPFLWLISALNLAFSIVGTVSRSLRWAGMGQIYGRQLHMARVAG